MMRLILVDWLLEKKGNYRRIQLPQQLVGIIPRSSFGVAVFFVALFV
jgi:hypothetical protein